ncbi:MAG: CbtA family protein [Methyloprofundus sp.]|nr:CbtA family protein [Methyloprofundus sp.]MDT8424503.1 CbtA family protein [Methyloprofundus sp.]
MYFRQIFLTACLTAIIASIAFSLYQFYFVSPLIFAAEAYEIADSTASESTQVWAPEEGIERFFFTWLANFLMSLAYSLLLACALSYRGSSSAVKGLAWGIGAYLAIFVAPSLGLPPEIPGMDAADLHARQTWWLLTVILSATGLAVLAFSPRHYKGAGLILILLPHLIGAPTPELHGFSQPDPNAVLALTGLWHQFVLQTSIANALLWLIIGPTSGFLCQRFIDGISPSHPSN